MKSIYIATTLLTSLIVLGACTTTKVEEEVIVVPPPIEQTCIPINTLRKVVIPAVTKSGFSIVTIENPDEQYFDPDTKKWVTIKVPPIERRDPWTKVITPEKIMYVDAENKEVTDICELNAKEVVDTVKEPAKPQILTINTRPKPEE